ncbi:MAG TPA: hypothetical protein PLE99_05650 [Candidatus Thiothrix moscowensis]|uniref:hypothetical protein n=1 Tax=unclassified Thiothrix TaxID=2636184 RepID=UPI0025F214EF|nr:MULTISPECIES: hypothetical protein [unclassified Thiothrix]HRJ52228.1 hypothetical protein [Candidatus Thiothrix moscowensis]HRJ92543.1 hypothetical protein [Candidatus Thiothrix moscowensis]
MVINHNNCVWVWLCYAWQSPYLPVVLTLAFYAGTRQLDGIFALIAGGFWGQVFWVVICGYMSLALQAILRDSMQHVGKQAE